MIYVNLFFNVSINFNIILFLFNDNLLKWIQMTLIILGWMHGNTFKFNTRDLIWRSKNDSSNDFFISIKNRFFSLGCIWFKDVVNEDAFVWEWMRRDNKVIQFLFRCWFCPHKCPNDTFGSNQMGFLNYEHFNSVIESTSVNSSCKTNYHSSLLYIRLRFFEAISFSSVVSLPILYLVDCSFLSLLDWKAL